MNFQTLKSNLVTILGTAAAGRYRTVGYQQQGDSATNTKGVNQSVQVFYISGNFPKSGASLRGPVRHEMTFRVELTASAAAKGNLAVLDNPASTEAQVAAAISGIQDAAALADAALDSLFSIIYGVLMDNRNLDVGLSVTVADRWIGGFTKNGVHPRGQLVTCTGNLDYTCTYFEELTGAERLNVDENGDPIPTVISVDLTHPDDTALQGVEVESPAPEE